MHPGRYAMHSDGRKLCGRVVSSGVFFYRIGAGDFTQTWLMIAMLRSRRGRFPTGVGDPPAGAMVI